VIGNRGGELIQYTPDGQQKASLSQPSSYTEPWSVSSVIWLENTIFHVSYASMTMDSIDDSESTFETWTIINDKAGTTDVFIGDPVPAFGDRSRESNRFYIHLRGWEPMSHLLVIADPPSTDVGVVASMTDTSTSEVPWGILELEDTARATLPTDAEGRDTFVVGFEVDLTSTDPINISTNGDDDVPPHPPAPVVLVYTNEGSIQAYNVLNSKQPVYPSMMPLSATSPTGSMDGMDLGSAPPSAVQENSASQTAFTGQPTPVTNVAPTQPLASGVPASGFGSMASRTTSAFGQSGFAAFSSTTSAFGSKPPPAFASSAFAPTVPKTTSTPTFGVASALGAKPAAFGSPTVSTTFGSSTPSASAGQGFAAYSSAPTSFSAAANQGGSWLDSSTPLEKPKTVSVFGSGAPVSESDKPKPSAFGSFGSSNTTSAVGSSTSTQSTTPSDSTFSAPKAFGSPTSFGQPAKSAFGTTSFSFGSSLGGQSSSGDKVSQPTTTPPSNTGFTFGSSTSTSTPDKSVPVFGATTALGKKAQPAFGQPSSLGGGFGAPAVPSSAPSFTAFAGAGFASYTSAPSFGTPQQGATTLFGNDDSKREAGKITAASKTGGAERSSSVTSSPEEPSRPQITEEDDISDSEPSSPKKADKAKSPTALQAESLLEGLSMGDSKDLSRPVGVATSASSKSEPESYKGGPSLLGEGDAAEVDKETTKSSNDVPALESSQESARASLPSPPALTSPPDLFSKPQPPTPPSKPEAVASTTPPGSPSKGLSAKSELPEVPPPSKPISSSSSSSSSSAPSVLGFGRPPPSLGRPFGAQTAFSSVPTRSSPLAASPPISRADQDSAPKSAAAPIRGGLFKKKPSRDEEEEEDVADLLTKTSIKSKLGKDATSSNEGSPQPSVSKPAAVSPLEKSKPVERPKTPPLLTSFNFGAKPKPQAEPTPPPPFTSAPKDTAPLTSWEPPKATPSNIFPATTTSLFGKKAAWPPSEPQSTPAPVSFGPSQSSKESSSLFQGFAAKKEPPSPSSSQPLAKQKAVAKEPTDPGVNGEVDRIITLMDSELVQVRRPLVSFAHHFANVLSTAEDYRISVQSIT
jgi:nucleoporin NUP159